MRGRGILAVILFLMSVPQVGWADNWTRFRGPNGQGVSAETNLPLKWSADTNVAWKTPIPGTGWSSPIVFGNRVFLTTATEQGASCRVICVHRNDGRLLWNSEVHRQKPGAKRRQNSYATPTPVTDGKRVYAVFYDGTAVAVDYTGKRVWKSNEVSFFSLHGLGASPILTDGKLIMPFDGSSRQEQRLGWKIPWDRAVIVAWDAETGAVAWKGKRGMSRVGHVTPILLNDGTQLVSAGGDRVQGFDVKTGKRIWSVYSQGEGVTPSPVVAGSLLITSSGFEAPTMRAIRMGGSGDVTETHIAWEQKKGVSAMASPLYVKPYVYTISRDNILHCLEASSGKVVWQRRLKGVHSASPILADGRIYITSEDGVTRVVEPGSRYKELAHNVIDEKSLATLAVSAGHFFLRTAENLYCIGPGFTE